MVGERSGVVVVEDLAVMVDILGPRRHIPDIPITVLPRRVAAGDRASGLVQWVVPLLATRWGEEARGMARLLVADGWVRDMIVTLGKAVHGLVRRRGSQLLLRGPGLGRPGGGECEQDCLKQFLISVWLITWS